MNDRTEYPEVDETPAGQQILLFSRRVLEALPTPSADVLSEFRVETTKFFSKKADWPLSTKSKTQSESSCSPQIAFGNASSARSCEDQCSLLVQEVPHASPSQREMLEGRDTL